MPAGVLGPLPAWTLPGRLEARRTPCAGPGRGVFTVRPSPPPAAHQRRVAPATDATPPALKR